MSADLEQNSPIVETTTTPIFTNKINKKKKQNKTKPSSTGSIFETPLNDNNSSNLNVLAAAMAASTTTASTILAAATQATKKIASETVKKISKEKASEVIKKAVDTAVTNEEEKIIPISLDESIFSFLPSSTSITTLLLGLDYIFYIWTFLLIAIVGYLSVYQYRRSKMATNAEQSQKLTVIEMFVKIIVVVIVRPVYYVLRFVFSYIWNNMFKSDSNIQSNLSSTSSNDPAAYAWLNNCFKWFYFSPETTKTININILETLNSVKAQIGQTLTLSTKQQLKFDDIYFKSVDTLPPKFNNIQTVMNATDNLTLRANVEFNNIEMKVEFKKTKRLIDLKMLSAKAQVLIVLSQNKNHVFSLECSLDQQSDLVMNFEKNQNIDADTMQYFEHLIQAAVKQTILNLELNSLNKSPNASLPSKTVFKTSASKPIAPQINQALSSASPTHTYNHAATSSLTKPKVNAFDALNLTNTNKNLTATTPTTPTNQLNKNEIINNLLLTTNLNANSTNNIVKNEIETIHLNEPNIQSNVQANMFSDYEEQVDRAEHVDNVLTENSDINNIQALAAVAAAANAKQLRNSVNEKRLLVKLIKATNLTNCEEPYIVVELDYPMQKHITDIHRDMSSINEQFFFDIIANSEELTFSIFDRAKDYGNDLVGEAVIPVQDLCSSLNAKRVIQLHRFGQTKTGSITAEFVFIEPSIHSEQNDNRLMARAGVQSRSSVSPFDQVRNPLNSDKRMNYRDDMIMTQQEQYQQKTNLNPDQLSDSEFSPPRSPMYNQSAFNNNMEFNNNNQAQSMHRSRQQAQQQQQQAGMSPTNRVINRNYLQTQATNYRAKTLDSRGSADFANHGDDILNNEVPLNTMDKRKRSISRSLKSLFNRSISSTSKMFSHKRDKSNDAQNNYEQESYDTRSVDNDKKLSSSIKRIFEGKNKNKKSEQYNQNGQRIGNAPAISISRPGYYPNQNNEYFMQPSINNNTINNQMDSNNFSNNLTEDIYNNKQPVLLRRRYRSP